MHDSRQVEGIWLGKQHQPCEFSDADSSALGLGQWAADDASQDSQNIALRRKNILFGAPLKHL